ncbi:PREDICTED: uncharacterized protein LOC108572962 [Habropoda laboriosa]|nr:PREDICTED: uncharacterized protein LOC108572962 [Habropoda laboriosa]
MPLYAAYLLLLPGILFYTLISHINAAPATYDQRQSGDFNVDARFDNFFVVVATSDNTGLLGNLAGQVLGWNELTLPQRSKQQTREKPSETMVYETEDADGGREPYHVEIVRIEKDGDHSDKSKHVDQPAVAKTGEGIDLKTSAKDVENSEKLLQQTPDTEVVIDDKKAVKKTRSLWKSEGGRVLIDGPLKANKGHVIDVSKLQVENFDHPDVLPVKEETSKATRPGISLKKQLSKKEEESMSAERNELGSKYQELVLIGGGIENCGPGRYRDKIGVCQTDKNFDESLSR